MGGEPGKVSFLKAEHCWTSNCRGTERLDEEDYGNGIAEDYGEREIWILPCVGREPGREQQRRLRKLFEHRACFNRLR